MIVTYFFIAVFVVCEARAIRSAWAAAYGEKVNLSANDEGSPRRFPLARFLHHTGGANAVEFALISPVFILLLFVSVELGLTLFTQSNLNYATRGAARLILTGQVQSGGGVSMFTSRLCSDVGSLIPCSSLEYNVQSGSSFSALSPTVQTNSSGDMTNTQFSPGSAGSDVLVQVGYPLPCTPP